MAKPTNKAKKPAKRPAAALDMGKNMDIEARDFGPIAKGKFDLRPLTVFAGPSNTGKSWMATLIYVLGRYSKYFEIKALRPIPDAFFDGDGYHTQRREKPSAEKPALRIPEDRKAWIDALEKGGKWRLTRGETEFTRGLLNEAIAGEIIFHLRRCYSVGEIADLVRNGSKRKSFVKFRVGRIRHHLELSSKMPNDSTRNSGHLNIDLPQNAEVPIAGDKDHLLSALHHRIGDLSGFSPEDWESMERLVSTYVLYDLIGKKYDALSQAHYLPSDRGGIMHAHAVVVRALIRRASREGLRPETETMSPSLPGVSGDFLENMIAIAENSLRRFGQFFMSGMSTQLEGKILQGEVRLIQTDTGYPMFVYRPKGWKNRELPLISASSMVTELSPVVLYMRHLVKPGDILIIDEPEAHLHPEAQRQFVEEIASWVRAGVRVVLTTHSDWILEALSSIVGRGEWKEKPANGAAFLDKKDVGVWIFDHIDPDDPGKGSKITEAPWDSDDGGYEVGFYDVAVESHNAWANAISRFNDEVRAESEAEAKE